MISLRKHIVPTSVAVATLLITFGFSTKAAKTSHPKPLDSVDASLLQSTMIQVAKLRNGQSTTVESHQGSETDKTGAGTTIEERFNSIMTPSNTKTTKDQGNDTRNLQGLNGSARFRANYVGRFQYLLDVGCSGQLPMLQVLCAGTLTILGTSDPTITCASPLPASDASFNGVQCINTCSDAAACRNVFLASGSVEDGPFGEIFFQCEGPDPADVDSAFIYEAGEGGQCDDGRNFHVAQLGIFCEDSGEFVFGDFYFECGMENVPGKFDSRYTCFEGRNCGSSACSVTFDPVIINTDADRLDCIQSLDGTDAPIPAIEPPRVDLRPPGKYTAQFQANWQLELDFFCSGRFVTYVLECTNGDIDLVSTTFDTTECAQVGRNVLECSELEQDAFVDRYSGAAFECTADDALPTVSVQYPEATVTCETSFSTSLNFHKMQLGVFCGDVLSGGGFFFTDFLFECAVGDDYEIDDRGRLTCREGAVIGPNDFEPMTVDAVNVFTDHRWSNTIYEDCYSFVPGENTNNEETTLPTPLPTSRPTMVPSKEPTKNPTATPRTSAPNPRPTVEPSDEPTSAPTTASLRVPATSAPNPQPTAEPSDEPTDAPTFQPTAEPTTEEPTLPPPTIVVVTSCSDPSQRLKQKKKKVECVDKCKARKGKRYNAEKDKCESICGRKEKFNKKRQKCVRK